MNVKCVCCREKNCCHSDTVDCDGRLVGDSGVGDCHAHEADKNTTKIRRRQSLRLLNPATAEGPPAVAAPLSLYRIVAVIK